MEGFGGSGINCFTSTVRKKRSNLDRRPLSDPQPLPDCCETSLLSSIPSVGNLGKVSSSESADCDSGSERVFSHNECAAGVRSFNGSESETAGRRNRKDDGLFGGFDEFYTTGGSRGNYEQCRSHLDFKRCSEGVLAPAKRKSMNLNNIKECFESQSRNPNNQVGNGSNDESQSLGHSIGSMNERKLRKVKLKVGGVTRTIHAKSTFDVASGDGSSSFKSFYSSDSPESQQKPIHQDTVGNSQSSLKKVNGLQGVPWKNFPGGSFSLRKEASSRTKMPESKTKHVRKRHLLDRAHDDSDEDEEIQYLEKLKHSRFNAAYGTEFQDDEEEGSKKQRKISSVLKNRTGDVDYDEGNHYSSKLERYVRQSRSTMVCGDAEYKEEMASDSEPEAGRKKQKKESVDSCRENKREMSLTKRQRALQSSKDMFTGTGANPIEFPNGLPPTPPRKQKEMLSEVEKQLKKAEAAQRRRMQAERAAKDSEAAAIRKILGQDSSMKKREDKTKKRRDEIAQDKAGNAMALASNSVRWVMGPSGTVVIFPKDMDLPSIFDSKPCSYPPPRETCAGPSCTNTYKYRDSKLKLPLCSLQCYRAIHKQIQPVSTC